MIFLVLLLIWTGRHFLVNPGAFVKELLRLGEQSARTAG
jgi:hypothetical protein